MPSLRVDILARADLDPASSASTVSCQDAREVILIHDVAVLRPLLLLLLSGVLLLILSKNEVTSPSSFSPTKTTPLSVGCTCDRLRNAVFITSLVVGVILSKVNVKLALRI